MRWEKQPDGYGLYVMVDHGHGWMTLYAHCSEVLIKEGQTVATGEEIALVGQTGTATGAHLHFELLSDGIYLNPEFYFRCYETDKSNGQQCIYCICSSVVFSG